MRTTIGGLIAAAALKRAPLLLFSELVGWSARRTLPKPLRSPLYRAFARRVGAAVEEAELPLDQYPSFGSFFARGLRPGSRVVATDEDVLVSPCDGVLAQFGRAERGRMIQAKGRDYSLRDLLHDDQLAEILEGGTYLTFYLSPKDYHRVHAPCDAEVTGYRYVPGASLPVNPFAIHYFDNVLSENERLVLVLSTDFGPVAYIMVAASGVGNMELCRPGTNPMESRHLRAWRRNHGAPGAVCEFDTPWKVTRGEQLGAFHLGSTVILVFPTGTVRMKEELCLGDAVRFGRPVLAPHREGGAAAFRRKSDNS